MSQASNGTRNGARRLLQTAFHLAPALLFSMGAAILLLRGVRRFLPPEQILACQDGVGDFLQALASIESVLLAFVVYMVWQQFDEARKLVEVEANELRDLERVVRGLPEPVRGVTRRLARNYARHVLTKEWPAMARGGEADLRDGWLMLDAIWDHLQTCRTSSECQTLLHEEALARFNDLSDARAGRLTCARRRIPASLRILLYTGSLALVAATALLPVQSLPLHAAMVAALAAGVSHILWVIHDLDDAFDGDWQVSRKPFERVLIHIDDEAGDR